jgi:hypothetical protein
MTDTISTDPATLRDLAATLRMDEVRVCPHYLKLDLLADTFDAIAAEKEAQAAPRPDDDYVDRFAVAMKAKLARAREKGRSGWQDMDAVTLSRMLWEHVEKGDPTDVANFCMFLWHHRAAIVPAAGYEIRPRVYTAGESLGDGLVAVPAYPTPAMQAAGEAVADRHILLDDARTPYLSNDGVIEVWAHILAALTEKGERS